MATSWRREVNAGLRGKNFYVNLFISSITRHDSPQVHIPAQCAGYTAAIKAKEMRDRPEVPSCDFVSFVVIGFFEPGTN